MLGDEPHLSRRRPARIRNQHSLDSLVLREFRLQFRACFVIADDANEDAAAASEAMLRATFPAPPILVSLRWTAMTGAGASGETRDTSPYTNSSSMRSPMQSTVRLEIRCDKASKSNMLPRLVAVLAEPVGGIEVGLHVKCDRLLQRREAAVIACTSQPIGLALGEVLVAAANRFRHVGILDIRLDAERGIG